MESNRQAHLELPDGRRIALQEVRGVYGASGYDVSSLYRRDGVLLYDPGFQSTASCRSAVSWVDGERGILAYRGYPIEELADLANTLTESGLRGVHEV